MDKIVLRKEDRDKIAGILSIIPGLGHLYKHYYLDGLVILLVGNTLMVFVAIWLALATLGLSLIIVPCIYFSGVAYSAYKLDDRHGNHHYLHPWR